MRIYGGTDATICVEGYETPRVELPPVTVGRDRQRRDELDLPGTIPELPPTETHLLPATGGGAARALLVLI